MNFEHYLSRQQESRQWGHALFSIAREMESHLDMDSLRDLMYQAGVRMAEGFPVMEKDSLALVEEVLNDIWMSCSWGWVTLTEGERGIHIEHAFAPLDTTFGEQAQAWSGQLLAGFYASVFRQLGAGDDLQLRQVKGNGNAHVVLFELVVTSV